MMLPNIVITTGEETVFEDFEQVSDRVWRTRFWDAGDGFLIRAIAHAPDGGRARVTYEWSPHKPAQTDPYWLNLEWVEMVFSFLQARLYIFYRDMYGFTAQSVRDC